MKRNRKPGSGAPAPAPADGSRNGDGASAWAGATLGSHGLGAAAAGAAGGKAVEACTSARVSDSSTSLKSSWGGTGHGASELPAVWPGARDSSHAACLDHCHVGHVLLHLRRPRLLRTFGQLALQPAGRTTRVRRRQVGGANSTLEAARALRTVCSGRACGCPAGHAAGSACHSAWSKREKLSSP